MASKKLIEKVENIVLEAMLHGSHPRNVAEAAVSIIFAALKDASGTMVDEAVSVDWSNEDERATAHNVWHVMLNASALGEQSE